MARKRRRFTAEFKARVALEALRERDSVQAIAARRELHPNQVTTWKRQLLKGLPEVFAGGAGRKAALEHEAKIRDLHAKIGELTVERDVFQRGLKMSASSSTSSSVADELSGSGGLEGCPLWRSRVRSFREGSLDHGAHRLWRRRNGLG